MKINIVMANWVSLAGGIRSTAVLADHLQKRGHEVYVVCPQKRRPTVRQQLKSLIKGKGLIASQLKGVSHFDDFEIPCRVLDHRDPVTDADLPDADIVMATWWETAEWVNRLSPSKGAKVYFIRHHEVFDYFPLEMQYKATVSYSLPLHKITISKWLLDLMHTKYWDHQVSYVPNSIELQKYYASPREKQKQPTIGLMYRDQYWKGCDISLKAFSLAAQKIPNLRLVAFGVNPPSPKLPLPEGTEYVQQPPQDQIKDIYARCDAWLFGSRFEGFGRPILEAMACRTPVIATPAGAAPELLEKGGGLLVKPEDSEDMAIAIEKICNLSNSEWKQLSDQAYANVHGYTWDDAAQLCEQAFETAIARTKRGELSSINPLELATPARSSALSS